MEKPDVDSIDGLSPAIAIDQKTTSVSYTHLSQSQVALRLLRDGKSQNLSATRQNVDTSIASSIMTVNQQKVGYVRIVTFGENIHEVIETKLQDMKSQKINHIIIDLRDNSGGYLNAAQEILDLFVPRCV